jgi:hypothetical protein
VGRGGYWPALRARSSSAASDVRNASKRSASARRAVRAFTASAAPPSVAVGRPAPVDAASSSTGIGETAHWPFTFDEASFSREAA